MSHLPILLQNISLSFASKVCFADFSSQICYGQKIAIIGRNGSGKSSLLKLLLQQLEAREGECIMPSNIQISYIEQIITEFAELSGGQRFDKALSRAFAQQPNCLLLDEPTNHLDKRRRHSLIKMLQHTQATVVMATHDTALIRNCADEIWHIENGEITIFRGSYDAYIEANSQLKQNLQSQLSQFKHQKKDTHNALMKEQERSSKRKKHGKKKYDGDKLAYLSAKGRGERTTSKRKKDVSSARAQVREQMNNLYIPEILEAHFILDALPKSSGNIVSIRRGSIGYEEVLLQEIFMDITAKERVVIQGNNGSGKTSLIKAMLGNNNVVCTGDWKLPNLDNIGYLDQNYATLDPHKTALEMAEESAPQLSHMELRDHLNSFLFRKNHEVNNQVSNLSGGEKARLSLALLALQPKQLLILDEVTNNVDLETKNHLIQALQQYPGAMVLVSHDEEFIKQLGLDTCYQIIDKQLIRGN